MPDFAALEHIPRVEAVRLLNHAAGGKGRLRAGESQGIVGLPDDPAVVDSGSRPGDRRRSPG